MMKMLAVVAALWNTTDGEVVNRFVAEP